jgi:hypothetical protein
MFRAPKGPTGDLRPAYFMAISEPGRGPRFPSVLMGPYLKNRGEWRQVRWTFGAMSPT